MRTFFLVILILYITKTAWCQSLSDDKRCKCICPKVSILTNNTEIVDGERIRYVANVPPNKCNCMDVVIPKIANQLNGKEGEFCPRCECKYENRNTTIIKVVVIIVIWIIAALVVYMAFLIVLDPLLNKRKKGSYQEHTNEEWRRKRYRQSRFNSDDELLNLLDGSDGEEVIENEDTMEMVYLPLEEYKGNSDEDGSNDELLDIRNIMNKNGIIQKCASSNRTQIRVHQNNKIVDSENFLIDLDTVKHSEEKRGVNQTLKYDLKSI
ncbi:uncharacterized protein LOC123321289 isoform X1 [Coccinella septempunctata]|uniref:uncharacterized protein LOC123321289 isoform X1 n=1 Tax=Coccinella septempunctata TaxID=41139 RepID=UPI001D075A9B|nr:uncharacterized protein LOC123321289 isoform X1 [Coccinella septempunctata]